MNGFPVIPVAETGETIRLLLDLIYPHIGEPEIGNVALFLNVCKAIRKYCMDIIEEANSHLEPNNLRAATCIRSRYRP
jgi:hypothetical protein